MKENIKKELKIEKENNIIIIVIYALKVNSLKEKEGKRKRILF